MLGSDLGTVLTTALQRANEEPKMCPFCAGKAYPGLIQGHRPNQFKDQPKGPGLVFLEDKPAEARGLKRFVNKIAPARQWWLPGAHIKTRSCGRCKQIFLWGVPLDDEFLRKAYERAGELYCPHCSTELVPGSLGLNPKFNAGARFNSDEAPELHKGWLGHEVIDKLFYSRWDVPVSKLPAQSCPSCKYTEVAGRPIYRFL